MKTIKLTNNKTGLSQELKVTQIREKGENITLTYNTVYGIDEITVNKETSTIEEIKIKENKGNIVDKLLNLRKLFIKLAKESNDCNSIYHAYVGDVFKGKGNDEKTKIWLMRKSKQELNNICNVLNKASVKIN